MSCYRCKSSKETALVRVRKSPSSAWEVASKDRSPGIPNIYPDDPLVYFMCSSCRNCKSTRGLWKYVLPKNKNKRKWKCYHCNHDIRKYVEINSYSNRFGYCTLCPVTSTRFGCICETYLGYVRYSRNLLRKITQIRKKRKKNGAK